MPEDVVADTHGLAVAGAGSTAAGDTVISGAPVTLPAGGPWTIFKVWALLAAATATAGESKGGYFRINAKSGDITPNPAPSKFPTGIMPSSLGATIDSVLNPITMFDVNYEASGKAEIELIYNEPTAVTVANQVVLGLIFGKTRPVEKPFTFVDVVRGQQSAVADTLIGTVTISEKASKIVAVCGCIAQDNVLTAGEELIGYFRLDSDDVKMPPSSYPFGAAYSAGLGALINQSAKCPVVWIPVEIPIIGGARVNCYIKLNTVLTNAAEVQIFIAYE